jgi:soluble lytic murein transglycosylase-like protein
MLLEAFKKHLTSGKTIGKRLIIGCNIMIFLFALMIVDRQMTKAAEVQSTAVVSNIVMLSASKQIDESAIAEKQESEDIKKARLASISHHKDIWEALRPWEEFIIRYCKEFGVDSDLVRAVLYTESKGDPYSVSPKGALGLMQITQTTADFMEADDIYDPEENIKTGVKYIAWLIKKYDETTALLAYNAGIGMLEQDRIPSETRKFIDKVLSIKKMLKSQKSKTT